MSSNSPITSAPTPLTLEQMKAIGKVCGQWSLAQSILEHFIWILIPVDAETGQAITTHLQDSTRIDIIRSLAAFRPEPNFAIEVDKVLKEYDDLRIQRNTIVHNSWAGDKQDLAVGFKISTRGGKYKTNRSHWSAADIEAIANEIEEWTVDMTNFIVANIGWPALRRPPEQANRETVPFRES